MTMWFDDPVFEGDTADGKFQLRKFAAPSFRLSLQSHWDQGHPFEYQNAYEKLFSVFEPVLKRDAERLLMIETAGKKPRRRKSITDNDWSPFELMRSLILSGDSPRSAMSEWRFIGFDFQGDGSGTVNTAKFFLNINDSIKLDAYIPVSDFDNGKLDIEALKNALSEIPAVTAVAGYGMCFLDSFDWPYSGEWALKPVAEKFPVLDLCLPGNRSWRSAESNNFKEYWLNGINWLTLVGEPILAKLGGASKLSDGLDSAIEVREGHQTVLFQLGSRPITGEKGVDDELLPLYFELGKRLQPIGDNYPSVSWRTQDVFGHVNDEAHKQLNNDWARRFYDQRWFERFS